MCHVSQAHTSPSTNTGKGFYFGGAVGVTRSAATVFASDKEGKLSNNTSIRAHDFTLNGEALMGYHTNTGDYLVILTEVAFDFRSSMLKSGFTTTEEDKISAVVILDSCQVRALLKSYLCIF